MINIPYDRHNNVLSDDSFNFYTEQKKKKKKKTTMLQYFYFLSNYYTCMIKSEIITFSSSALAIRLSNVKKKNDFHFNEYFRAYSMSTTGILKAVKHTVCMRKH